MYCHDGKRMIKYIMDNDVICLEEVMLTERYAEILTSAVENIKKTQKEKILDAAKIVKNTIKNDGLILSVSYP